MRSKNPLIMLMTAFIAIGLLGIALIQLFQTEVVIVDGGSELKIVTFSKNVGDLIRWEGLKLKPLDEVYPSLETPLTEGLRIVIHRFRPIVVDVNGKEIEVYEKNLSARGVLLKAGVTFGGTDQLNVSMDRIIKSGERLVVSKEETTTLSVEKELPYENKIVKTTNLSPGVRRIEQYGTMGVQRDYYEITMRGGVEVSRKLLKSEVLSQPVTQIMQVGPDMPKTQMVYRESESGGGQKPAVNKAASPSQMNVPVSRGKSFAYKASYMMMATAYDLSFESTGKVPGMPDYGITASGTKARVGVVAVDPTVIPLGTKLYIEYADGTGSYGYATAEDTGSAIKGNRIDLFFNTYQECINFGRRSVIVYILE